MMFFKKNALLAGIQQKNGSTYTKRRQTASKLHLLNKKPKEQLTMDIKKIGIFSFPALSGAEPGDQKSIGFSTDPPEGQSIRRRF